MPYELFLALRYMRARRGRRVARWTAAAAVGGLACGVAALTLATALANGFRDELQDKILRGTAHVTLSRADGGAVEDPRAVAGRVRRIDGVLDATPTTYEGALLTGPNGAAYTLLRGLDAGSARAREKVRSEMPHGSLEPLFPQKEPGADEVASVVLGEGLSERTGLKVGDEGWVLTGALTPGAAGYVPRSVRVRVAGLFRSGLYDYDSTWTYAD